jgi:hypothetical protein
VSEFIRAQLTCDNCVGEAWDALRCHGFVSYLYSPLWLLPANFGTVKTECEHSAFGHGQAQPRRPPKNEGGSRHHSPTCNTAFAEPAIRCKSLPVPALEQLGL